jgi:hypothetical protein
VLPEAGAPGTLTARKENNKLIQEAFTVLYRNRGKKQVVEIIVITNQHKKETNKKR